VVDKLGSDARVLQILFDEFGVLFVELLRRGGSVGCWSGLRFLGLRGQENGGQKENFESHKGW
jgi:hypothetical protein